MAFPSHFYVPFDTIYRHFINIQCNIPDDLFLIDPYIEITCAHFYSYCGLLNIHLVIGNQHNIN